jgi:hypothetical protein
VNENFVLRYTIIVNLRTKILGTSMYSIPLKSVIILLFYFYLHYTVGCHIPSFPHNITLKITNSKVHVGLPANFTIIGSEIQLFCNTNQKHTRALPSPVLTAICGENGTWSPEISHHIKCIVDQKSSDGKLNIIASWFV